MTPDIPPILVIGVGNPLMGDEGVGPRLVEFLLDGYEWPDTVDVEDVGTMGYMIIDMFRGREHVLVLDAIRDTGLEPGSILQLTPDEIAPNQILHSLHDLAVADVFQAANFMGLSPEVVCIGVQIEKLEQWVMELSEKVDVAIPMAAAVALEVLAGWGVEPRPREESDAQAQVIRAMRTYEPIPAPTAEPES